MILPEVKFHQHAKQTAQTKCKLFIRKDLDGLEEEVNDWISSNNIQVSHFAQSQCERRGFLLFVLTVFYIPPQPSLKGGS
jgi:hypothetical protein